MGFDIVEDRSDTGAPRRRYYAQVEFQAATGEKHWFSSGDGHSAPFYRTGEIVDVLYPADDPSKAEVHSFSAIWAGPIAAGLLGVAFIAGGIWEWRERRRERTSLVGTVVRIKG